MGQHVRAVANSSIGRVSIAFTVRVEGGLTAVCHERRVGQPASSVVEFRLPFLVFYFFNQLCFTLDFLRLVSLSLRAFVIMVFFYLNLHFFSIGAAVLGFFLEISLLQSQFILFKLLV